VRRRLAEHGRAPLWRDPRALPAAVLERIRRRVDMTGDARAPHQDGYYWILGRVDDVMNVSGHRLSTMEIESRAGAPPRRWRKPRGGQAARDHRPGGGLLRHSEEGHLESHELAEDLRKWVAHEIAASQAGGDRFTDSLPKTRSGKIMRRLLREIVTSNSVTGDVTTLEDLSVVTRLAAQHDEE